MTRVLLVLRSDGVGGAERSMDNLILILDRLEIGWDLVTLRPPKHGPGPLAKHEPTVLDLPARSHVVRRWRQLWWLREVLSTDRYRAVVAFGPQANGLVALAAGRGGPTVVISERGDPYIPRRRWWNRAFMWTYRRADVLVVPTRLLAEEVLGDGNRPSRVEVIANALSPDIPFVGREAPREKTIVFVGRLAPVKRVDDLVEAVHLLGDELAGWEVVVVGDGPERSRLESLVRDRSLTDRVRFVGEHASPWDLLARADILVLCSSSEGFSNVLIEAMASGCAVVSSDCRFGPRELVESGVNGILYPTGDIGALAAVLGELIDAPDRRDALGRAANERAYGYTLDAIAARWRDLIVADRPGRRATSEVR